MFVFRLSAIVVVLLLNDKKNRAMKKEIIRFAAEKYNRKVKRLSELKDKHDQFHEAQTVLDNLHAELSKRGI